MSWLLLSTIFLVIEVQSFTYSPISTRTFSAASRQVLVINHENSYNNNIFTATTPSVTSRTTTSTTRPMSISLSAPLSSPSSIKSFVCLLAGFGFLLGYHVRLAVSDRAGVPSWRSSQADTRERWSRHVRETAGWLYAVQTLRNAITANTFLATTVLSLLTLIGGRIWDILRVGATIGISSNTMLLKAQLTSITVCMLSSAYYFLQSARLMTHAGFMFPVDQGSTKVDLIMRKTQNAQWSGLRWLYCSIGMVIWVVAGEESFLASTVGLLYFFHKVDAAPQESDNGGLTTATTATTPVTVVT